METPHPDPNSFDCTCTVSPFMIFQDSQSFQYTITYPMISVLDYSDAQHQEVENVSVNVVTTTWYRYQQEQQDARDERVR